MMIKVFNPPHTVDEKETKRIMKRWITAALLLLITWPMAAQEALTIGRAEAIILQAFPEATVIAMQRVQQGATLIWEAQLEDGTWIVLDARTGEITNVIPPELSPALGVTPMIVPPAQPTALAPAPARGLPAISFARALEIAQMQYPDAALVAATLESNRWEMRLSNGMAVRINARTGAVVQLEALGTDLLPIPLPAVSLEQALSVAQGFYPRRNFTRLDLAQVGRSILWKIVFGRDQEVHIDAITGAVLRTR